MTRGDYRVWKNEQAQGSQYPMYIHGGGTPVTPALPGNGLVGGVHVRSRTVLASNMTEVESQMRGLGKIGRAHV